jgi:hypothetical protein
MADTSSPTPADSTPKSAAELRRTAYEFCEKTLARFEALPLATLPKGFQVARSQTISGDTVERTYLLRFDLKLTGCELPAD